MDHATTGADTDQAIRGHLREFFWANRYLGPLGNTAGAMVFVGLSHDAVPSHRLIAWWCSMMVVAASLHLLLRRPERMLARTGTRVSAAALLAHGASGLLWGLTPWLALDPHAEYPWIALCFMFAVSAGTMAGITGVTSLTMASMVPIWSVGGAAFVMTGRLLVAVGGAIFVLLVLHSATGSSQLLLELIRLRSRSAAAAARAEWEASHDLLTGLPNRAGLQDCAAELHAAGHPARTAMFIDLDHFKEVNDRFGHPVGDELLTQVARRLEHVLPDDVVGRLGGDEFLVLLARPIDDEAVDELAAAVIDTLEAPFQVGPHEAYVSASIGVTRHPRGLSDVSQLMRESDEALYHAKRNGRRQVVRFDAQLRRALDERSGLEMALRRAIREEEITAWGQPVYDVRSGEVVWVELLARWETTGGTFVPPSVFIPLAEEIGVIADLDRQMLAHAADALARWRTHPTLGGVDVAVNVSALHLRRDDLVADVLDLVARRDLTASRLVVELTESDRLTDVDSARATFERLAELGVRLAVDDFGTGYSSLGQLLELPVSIVKLDRSLTAGCEHDPHRAGVARAVHHLAASLGHVVVAEGVETPGAMDCLAAIGIDQVQGYLLCPPLSLEALEEELTSATATVSPPREPRDDAGPHPIAAAPPEAGSVGEVREDPVEVG